MELRERQRQEQWDRKLNLRVSQTRVLVLMHWKKHGPMIAQIRISIFSNISSNIYRSQGIYLWQQLLRHFSNAMYSQKPWLLGSLSLFLKRAQSFQLPDACHLGSLVPPLLIFHEVTHLWFLSSSAVHYSIESTLLPLWLWKPSPSLDSFLFRQGRKWVKIGKMGGFWTFGYQRFLSHHTLFKLWELSLKHVGYLKIFFCPWVQVLFY